MKKTSKFSLLLVFFELAVFKVHGQQTSSSESKRKASEYFCVAQCLGLLGSDRPKEACYDEGAKQALKVQKTCDEFNYDKVGECCKEYPGDLMPLPTNANDSKACTDMAKGPLLEKFINTYVITGPMNMAGRLDFSNGGAEVGKRYGKQLCYMDCIFEKKKLQKPDGAIDFQAAKKEFESAANGTVWRNLISNAYVSCLYLLTGNSNIPKTVPGTLDSGKNQECKTTAGLLYQCIKRHMIVNCPAASKTMSTQNCKDMDYYSYSCDPFK